jgi:hypothetical protein
VERAGAVAVDPHAGDQAEVVPVSDGELVDAQVGGDLGAGAHAVSLQIGVLVSGGEIGGGDGGSAGRVWPGWNAQVPRSSVWMPVMSPRWCQRLAVNGWTPRAAAIWSRLSMPSASRRCVCARVGIL